LAGARQTRLEFRAITETEETGFHKMAILMREVISASDSPGSALDMLKWLALAKDASA
jgi:hypothetical protein